MYSSVSVSEVELVGPISLIIITHVLVLLLDLLGDDKIPIHFTDPNARGHIN